MELIDRSLAPSQQPLASIRVLTSLSIIIPTYKEVPNIPLILQRIDALRREGNLALEVIFMDDDSRDGSIEAVEQSGYDWARIVVRTENRGLSPAVIDGFRLARNPVLICMDCDLSHPPEVIPQMMLALSSGQQFIIGSRYVPGGSTDDDWGIIRWLNSRMATLLALPLTSAKDPMSGFFALRKADFDEAVDLNPVGYKVALEPCRRHPTRSSSPRSWASRPAWSSIFLAAAMSSSAKNIFAADPVPAEFTARLNCPQPAPSPLRLLHRSAGCRRSC